MGRLERYRTYLSNGLLAHKLLRMLSGAGIVIEPYYFYQEGTTDRVHVAEGRRFEEYDFFEAGTADTDGIAALDPNADHRGEIRNNFRNGKRCFALTHAGRIVAVSWCDIREIGFEPCRRPLERDEAYLYGMETLYAYRGHNLAPFLRTRCLELLRAEGRNVIYSYSDRFNHPAVRFKEKIGAKVLFTGLYVKLFDLPGWNRIVRTQNQVLRAPARKT
jgi:GNAT superfamily N-acetyltransferase